MRRVNAALGALSVAGVLCGVRVATLPLADLTLPEGAGARAAGAASSAGGRVDSLAAAIVRRDPFRLSREPAATAYDPVRLAQPAEPAPPRPALVLTGIVWDAHGNPSAVLDGLPGVEGARVVRQDDRIGALVVRRIARDQVVVVGLDTTWVLSVKEPWK